MHRLPRFRTPALVATGLLLSALAGTAPAATVTAEGDTLVYRGAAGERNGVVLNGYVGNRIRFNEAGQASITAWPAGCEPIEPDGVLCPVPATVRIELADGNDTFGLAEDAYGHGLVVLGGDGDDELSGHGLEARAKTFDGGPGNDLLKGYAGDDVLRGGPGNDILWGDLGNDELRGEDGDDQLKPDNGKAPGNDVVDGGPGFDVVDDWIDTSAASPPPVNISLDGVANDGRPGETDNVMNIEKSTMYVSGRFVLSDGPDDWTFFSNVDGGPSTIFGGAGNDRITGDDHNETIDGGPGDDVLEGGKRDDTIVGGPGHDSILGDESDTGCTWAPEYCLVFGNDVIDVRDGEKDEVNCGPGNDQVIVDALDVYAGCEVVEGPGAPGGDTGTPGGDTGTPGGDTGTPGGGAKARLTPVSRRLRTALRSGLPVRVTGAKPGRLRLVARRRGKVVASGAARVPSSGKTTVRLQFTASARRSLAQARTVRLVVSGGGLRAAVTLKR